MEIFASSPSWTRILGSALIGGPQSAFLAAALVKDRVVGVCAAGDSRLYHLPFGGEGRWDERTK